MGGEEANSEPLTTLERGSLVVQLGEEKQLENGLVRMMIETLEPQSSIRGWVNESKEPRLGVRGGMTLELAVMGKVSVCRTRDVGGVYLVIKAWLCRGWHAHQVLICWTGASCESWELLGSSSYNFKSP